MSANPAPESPDTDKASTPSRRNVLRASALGAAAVGAVPVLDACGGVKSSGSSGGSSSGAARTIKIGYVTPQTGALAPFGETDSFVVGALRDSLKITTSDGKKHPVEIIVKDTQSDTTRAASVARDLVNQNKVDILLVSSTPETTNPVSDVGEANGIPTISTVAPWQSWYVGRGGDPTKTTPAFTWTYHFFWGLEDVIAVYTDMWNQVKTTKKVGGLFPNDSDGNAWSDKKLGFPPAIAKQGYSITDPGHFPDGTNDYSAQISRFKSAKDEIIMGVPQPPDAINFLKQASAQGLKPKIATIGKALLFPSTIEAIGSPAADNLGTEVWWTPQHPFTSSLTGQSAKALSDEYTAKTGKQWSQPIGFVHALFEVANAAFAKVADPGDRQGLINAVKALELNTIVGPLDWTKGPVPNVAKTPLVGGQWRKGTKYKFDLVVVSNKELPSVPLGGKVEPTNA